MRSDIEPLLDYRFMIEVSQILRDFIFVGKTLVRQEYVYLMAKADHEKKKKNIKYQIQISLVIYLLNKMKRKFCLLTCSNKPPVTQKVRGRL